jgi:hypothetical protein
MIDKMRLRRFDMSNPPQKSIDIVNQSFDSVDYDSPRSNSKSPKGDNTSDPRYFLFA